MTNWIDVPPAPHRVTLMGWLRVVLRGASMAVLAYSGLLLLLIVRLVEWPIFGMNRPWTPWITQATCRATLFVMGLRLVTKGRPMTEKGAVVANHSSWLDILVLNAGQRIYFVSKSEVASWPGIGWLAKANGTVFITRKGTEAKRQQEVFENRLRGGHQLLFFPEGTSTDAIRVLPFKSTLFQAFFSHGLDRVLHIQPVTVVYHAPKGEDARFYGWWGPVSFFGNMLKVLSQRKQGWVEVVFHAPVPVDAFESRKELARYCENVVRTSHVTSV